MLQPNLSRHALACGCQSLILHYRNQQLRYPANNA